MFDLGKFLGLIHDHHYFVKKSIYDSVVYYSIVCWQPLRLMSSYDIYQLLKKVISPFFSDQEVQSAIKNLASDYDLIAIETIIFIIVIAASVAGGMILLSFFWCCSCCCCPGCGCVRKEDRFVYINTDSSTLGSSLDRNPKGRESYF